MRMNEFYGKTLSWTATDGVIELALHREPSNEIGSETLLELERLGVLLASLDETTHALIIYSKLPAGFCAGAALREDAGAFARGPARGCEGLSRTDSSGDERD